MNLPDATASPLEHGIVLLLLVERIVDKVWERWKTLRTQGESARSQGERIGKLEDAVAEFRGAKKVGGGG